MTSAAPTDDAIRKLVSELTSAYDATTEGKWDVVDGPPDAVHDLLTPARTYPSDTHEGTGTVSGVGGTVFQRKAINSAIIIASNTYSDGDAAFIAAAHNAMPTLLAALRALDAERQAAQARDARLFAARNQLALDNEHAWASYRKEARPDGSPRASAYYEGYSQALRHAREAIARALEGDDDERP